jgi:hypothetical protein
MAKNRQKLFVLTKYGHQLVEEALDEYDSLHAFCEKNSQRIHRQTFTAFCKGKGKERGTAETYCDALKIPNWQEDWDKIFEIAPDKIDDWSVYDDRWVGRKKLVGELTKKIGNNCRLLLLLGITGIGKTALAEKVADDMQTRFVKILRVNFDSDDSVKDFAGIASRWLEELGESLAIADKQPMIILKRLVNQLREERILVLIDSLEALLAESEDGWGDFEDEYWTKFFESFLVLESSQSTLIVTSQDLPTKIEGLASRYPNNYYKKVLCGLQEDEQIALFEKVGLDVSINSENRTLLMKIGKIYRGHPLMLRVLCGEIVESFADNVLAFWGNVGEEIELVEKDLAEAEAGLQAQGDDDWKLHKLTRDVFVKVYQRRLDAAFKRLKSQNADAYILICVAAIYRRPVQESGWLLQLDSYIQRLKNEVYSKEQQLQVLENLFGRFLVETSINHNDRRILGMHNLIRSVALEHRKDLFSEFG